MVVVVVILIVKARIAALPGAAAIPGVVIFMLLWLVTWRNFDFASSVSENIDFLWQSLGNYFLTTDPLGSLSVLHIQPPLLNALFAFDLWVTPSSHLVLGVLYFLCALGSVVLVVDTSVRLGVPRVWAAVSGVILALLPGTVLYSLWTYNVTITAFLAISAVWGVALFKSRPVSGTTVSIFSVLGLVLTRSTFVWVLLIVWAVLLVFMLMKSRSRIGVRALRWSIVAVVISVGMGIALQVHYFSSFGLATMSSWSGQNMAKALTTSSSLHVTPSARAEIAADPCLNDLLIAFENRQVNVWDPGGQLNLPGCVAVPRASERGILAWDAPYKGVLGLEGDMNYNMGNALVASQQWSSLMSIVVRADPLQLTRMAFGTSDGTRASGVELYLSSAEAFPFISEQMKSLPFADQLNVISRVFAPVTWILILLGWVSALVVRSAPLRGMWAYWLGSGLLIFHALGSVFLEYGENMRFRAELDPVLLMLATVSLFSVVSALRSLRKGAPAEVVQYE